MLIIIYNVVNEHTHAYATFIHDIHSNYTSFHNGSTMQELAFNVHFYPHFRILQHRKAHTGVLQTQKKIFTSNSH